MAADKFVENPDDESGPESLILREGAGIIEAETKKISGFLALRRPINNQRQQTLRFFCRITVVTFHICFIPTTRHPQGAREIRHAFLLPPSPWRTPGVQAAS